MRAGVAGWPSHRVPQLFHRLPRGRRMARDDDPATPPMGHNGWTAFKKDVDGDLVRAQADAMVDLGLAEAGYEYLVLDGGWRADERDDEGEMRADPEDFPAGIGALADYVHERGLQFGLHQGVGLTDCRGETPGTQSAPGGEHQDAARFAAWGVDFLKYDMCGGDRFDYPDTHGSRRAVARRAYERMGAALAAQDRGILFAVCDAGAYNPWEWARGAGGDIWRTAGDIGPRWERVLELLDRQAGLAEYAGPGGFNDPDTLQVGNGLATSEGRAQFSLWSVLAAPLFVGSDLRELSTDDLATLTNEAVIAVNQDPAGVQARRVRSHPAYGIWAKPLAGGDVAAVIVNRNDDRREVTTSAAELGLEGRGFEMRDLWTDEEWRTEGRIEVAVPGRDAVMVRVSSG
ncbi:MAG: glycoside hydrolase family 27 protein [Halobacteriaceae archaeon]